MDIAWCMAIVLIVMHVCLMAGLGILSLSCSRVMVEMWVDVLAPVVSTRTGMTNKFRVEILSIRSWYFYLF